MKGSHTTQRICPLKIRWEDFEEAYYHFQEHPINLQENIEQHGQDSTNTTNGNSLYPDRRQTLEESLTKFMVESAKRHEENSNIIKEIRASTDAAIRNQGASIKTLEIQIGQMSKVLQERGIEALVDLGASVSVMPFSTYSNLGLVSILQTLSNFSLKIYLGMSGRKDMVSRGSKGHRHPQVGNRNFFQDKLLYSAFDTAYGPDPIQRIADELDLEVEIDFTWSRGFGSVEPDRPSILFLSSNILVMVRRISIVALVESWPCCSIFSSRLIGCSELCVFASNLSSVYYLVEFLNFSPEVVGAWGYIAASPSDVQYFWILKDVLVGNGTFRCKCEQLEGKMEKARSIIDLEVNLWNMK
ncbi:hypothetical protein Tco_0033600 [Tanacetum coccineum]